MFKNLFRRNKVPTNSGNPEQKLDQHRWVKTHQLELSNMEDSPRYDLSHQLSVGSEIGNIVIADPSLSPRHATFILQQEVVSIIDHASVSGTYVNGNKITAGKFIILEESDVILLGDLEIKIHTSNNALDERDVPAVPGEDEEEVDEEVEEEIVEEEIEEVEEDDEGATRPIMRNPLAAPAAEEPKKVAWNNKKPKAKKTFSLKSYSATNSLVRVIAVFLDLLVSYSILILLLPFDEFKDLLGFLPAMVNDFLDVEISQFWLTLKTDFAVVAEILEEVVNQLSVLKAGPLLLTFILLRIVSTFLFGVSLSELLLGVRSYGNSIWCRVGGVLRVLIGVITGPFLIFDLPAIISRRTFKEVITYTNTYNDSKFLTILGVIFITPLFLALALLAPIFQGLELVEPIDATFKISSRVKAIKPETEGVETPVVALTQGSQYLGVELNYQPADISVIPHFKFQGEKKKLSVQGELFFYQKELDRVVSLELLKKFDMRQLLEIGMKGNVFLYEKYPRIYEFVYAAPQASKSLKAQADENKHKAFANEFLQFTQGVFELSPDNVLDYMQTMTPLIHGPIDFRASLLALIGDNTYSQIKVSKIGNVNFLHISYKKAKPYELLIPIVIGEGRIYKVTFDSGKNLAQLSARFYKFTLDKTDWIKEIEPETSEVLSPFQVLDLFTVNFSKEKLLAEQAQSLYGYYFEKSADVLTLDKEQELGAWKKSVNSVHQILMIIGPTEQADPQNPVEDPVAKLIQNFNDLKTALENKDKQFFGIQTTTI